MAYIPTQLVALCQIFWQNEAGVRALPAARERFVHIPDSEITARTETSPWNSHSLVSKAQL